MNDTETEQETKPTALDWSRCPICSVPLSNQTQYQFNGVNVPPYAHGTCSQECARTAAIVEAINGWRSAAVPAYRITEQPYQVWREIPAPMVPGTDPV